MVLCLLLIANVFAITNSCCCLLLEMSSSQIMVLWLLLFGPVLTKSGIPNCFFLEIFSPQTSFLGIWKFKDLGIITPFDKFIVAVDGLWPLLEVACGSEIDVDECSTFMTEVSFDFEIDV